MKTKKIYDENGNGFTRIFSSDEVVNVNPLEYYRTYEVEKRAIILRDLLFAKYPFLTAQLDHSFFIKNAEKTLEGFFEKFEKKNFHENFQKLLETSRKKDQIDLLKGMSLNSEQLISLIFFANIKFGYLYSNYCFENLPNGFAGKKLPNIFSLKVDGSIKKVGETELTDGELKNIIEHRKVIISHFLESEKLWHCIFTTHNSVGGKENWKDGQPHFHYISSSFGISKEEFIESMKIGKYKSTSVHIDLLDYGL